MNKQVEDSKLKGREMTGKVISVKMQKTVIVEVMHLHKHELYRKAVRRTKHFAAHNEREDIHVGDVVKISEVRPISKTKHFKVIEKVS